MAIIRWGHGCDFCESDYNLLYRTEPEELVLETRINMTDDGEYYLSSFVSWNDDSDILRSADININYCPKCGRPLNLEEHKYWIASRASEPIFNEIAEGVEHNNAAQCEEQHLIDTASIAGFHTKDAEAAIKFLVEDGHIEPEQREGKTYFFIR